MIGKRGFGTLISETVADFQLLFRQIFQLATAEIKKSARHAGLAVLFMVLAVSVFTVVVMLSIIAIAFLFVALGMPTWLAFFADAGLFLIVALLFIWISIANAKKVKAPTKAADAFQKSVNDITATVTRTNI